MNVSIKGKILNYADLETDLGYEGDRSICFSTVSVSNICKIFSEEHNLV